MSPNNAEVVIAVPLFRNIEQEYNGVIITLQPQKPLAYLLDAGFSCQVVGADWVEKNLIFLGDL